MHHDYHAIVQEALSQPGKMAAAYSALHDFSIGNQWLAIMQMGRAEPIATFPKWKELGRHVKKGEHAIELLMPVFKKTKQTITEPNRDDHEGAVFFIARKHWFGVSQTDGAEYVPNVPGFDLAKALADLQIAQEPYRSMNGNSMGYARTAERVIAVSPLAFDPFKTAAHEIVHVLLHPNLHSDHEDLPRDVKEVEAETGAYLVKTALGQTQNLEYSRGYIQHWLADTTVEKVRLNKVFAAVDQILKAGRLEPEPSRPTVTPQSDAEVQLTA